MPAYILGHLVISCSSLREDLAEAWSKLVSLRSIINIFKGQIDEAVLEEVENRRGPQGMYHANAALHMKIYNDG